MLIHELLYEITKIGTKKYSLVILISSIKKIEDCSKFEIKKVQGLRLVYLHLHTTFGTPNDSFLYHSPSEFLVKVP